MTKGAVLEEIPDASTHCPQTLAVTGRQGTSRFYFATGQRSDELRHTPGGGSVPWGRSSVLLLEGDTGQPVVAVGWKSAGSVAC